MRLAALIEELETYIPAYQKTNSAVSSATVGWQIAHTLKVVNGVVHSLKASKPKEYQYKFNWTKFIILTINRIPRGKGRAPKVVHPKEEDLVPEQLKEQIALAKESIIVLDRLPKKAFFKHPVFGMLQRKETEKFLKIHTQHHVSIIRDMLQKK